MKSRGGIEAWDLGGSGVFLSLVLFDVPPFMCLQAASFSRHELGVKLHF